MASQNDDTLFERVNRFTDGLFAIILLISSVAVTPSIGLFIGFGVITSINTKLVEKVDYGAQNNASLTELWKIGSSEVFKTCSALGDSQKLSTDCERADAALTLIEYSSYTLALGVLIVSATLLTRILFGRNRSILARLFPPLIVTSMFALTLSVIMQGWILCYSVLVIAKGGGKVPERFIAVIVIAASVAAYGIIKNAITVLNDRPSFVNGRLITKENAPALLRLISDVANSIGANPPDNVVVGLEPNFYATSTSIQLMGSQTVLHGSTMFISVPLLGLFTLDETRAVIGHELGHFIGNDTYYTRKFYPAYIRLSGALAELRQSIKERITNGILVLPTLGVLSFIHGQFARSERSIGRKREHEADKIGASINGGLPLITALLKLVSYSGIWTSLRKANLGWLSKGDATPALAAIYSTCSDLFGQRQ